MRLLRFYKSPIVIIDAIDAKWKKNGLQADATPQINGIEENPKEINRNNLKVKYYECT